jgi:hypothetical protein
MMISHFDSSATSSVLRHRRRGADRIRGGEEHRLDVVEIAFLLHALHEDRADHAAPTYQTY